MTDQSNHPDLADEQAHIDRAYRALVDVLERALAVRNLTEGQRGGTFQERYERNYFDEKLVQMLNGLDIGDAALAFGRIDRTPDGGGNPEAFHIGRLAVADADLLPVVARIPAWCWQALREALQLPMAVDEWDPRFT